jgi:uncharacterized glyoxalase superfamily protein PhnB
MSPKPGIIPGLRYNNAPAAIDFLCRAFGFETHAVYADPGDPTIIQHAQLVRDGQMIMLGTHRPTPAETKGRMLSPGEARGNTMSCYITVADVDAHAAIAEAAGADLVMRPMDQDYGGRGYSALDPEGYVWSFGSYDPWAG